MREELFPLTPEEQQRVRRTCRTCAHRERWCIGGNRIFQYCGVRKSGRTSIGLLKIKVTTPACGFYKED